MTKLHGEDSESAQPWLELVRKSDRELLDMCRLDVFRGSGRGGQKRNKTSNAVRLTIFDLAVTESAARSRAQNIAKALRKLRLAVALSLSPRFQRGCVGPSLPDDLRAYLGDGIIRISPHNSLFPVWAGSLVDLFIEHEGKWSEVAAACGVSNTQLRRFAEKHPALLGVLKRIQGDRNRHEAETTGE